MIQRSPSFSAFARRISGTSESGFALVLMLSIVVLLFTLLMAVQGSVMMTRSEMARGTARADRQLIAAGLIERARVAARGMDPAAAPLVLSREDGAAEASVRILAPDDPVYKTGAGLAHRHGDAAMTVTFGRAIHGRPLSFLINGARLRASAIQLP